MKINKKTTNHINYHSISVFASLSKWLIITATITICYSGCIPKMDYNTGQRQTKREFQTNSAYNKSKKYRDIRKEDRLSEKEQSVTAGDNGYFDENNYLSSDDYKQSTNDPIAEFEKKINRKSVNTNPVNTNPDNKTNSSLKSQLEELDRRQAQNEDNIYSIKEDIIEIKGMIGEIAADRQKISSSRDDYKSPGSLTGNPVINLNGSNNKSHSLIESDENYYDASADDPPKVKPEKKTESKSEPAPKKNTDLKIVKASNTVKNTPTKNTDSPKQTSATKTDTDPTIKDFSGIIAAMGKQDYKNAINQIKEKMEATNDQKIIANCNYWLGEASFNQRDYAKSIDYFKQTLDLVPDKKDVVHARIAESYMRVGKNEEAKNAYMTLLREFPQSSHSPKARKMLQQL